MTIIKDHNYLDDIAGNHIYCYLDNLGFSPLATEAKRIIHLDELDKYWHNKNEK